MKYFIFFFVFRFSCFSQSDFKKIKGIERKDLINKIIPNKNYPYWAYKWYLDSSNIKNERTEGDSTKYKNIKIPDSGFFLECMPGGCFSYIVYDDFGKIKYITNESELKKFIGKIDNLEEALLVAKINDLWYNKDYKRGGSYKKTKNGFELFLTKFEMCPIKYYSIKANIDTLGNFKFKSIGVYYKSPGCILE